MHIILVNIDAITFFQHNNPIISIVAANEITFIIRIVSKSSIFPNLLIIANSKGYKGAQNNNFNLSPLDMELAALK